MRWISSPQKIRWKTEFANDLNLNERQDPRFLNPTPYIPPTHPSKQEKKSGVCLRGEYVGGWVSGVRGRFFLLPTKKCTPLDRTTASEVNCRT